MAQNFQLISCITLLFILLPVPSNSKNPFGFLNHLLGCHKGEKLVGLHQLKQYLNKFGYLNHQSSKSHFDDYFDDFLEAAMKMYQANYNLKITGTLDPETLSKMVMPRCGVPDVINGTSVMKNNKTHQHHHHSTKTIHTVSHYSLFRGFPRWPVGKTHLTYWFDLRIMHPASMPPFVRAFNKWAFYTGYFSFQETKDYKNADLKISFERGNHGPADTPFDGRGGVLAHAFPPTDGRLHCDAEELFSIGALPNYTDLETVALHEIGHLLGLDHSTVADAIMYPTIPPNKVKNLHADDIQGIRALYKI